MGRKAAGQRCVLKHGADLAVMIFRSEAGLAHAGDLALVSQLAEADTADAVVAQVSVRTAADLAAVVLTGRELRRSLLLENHRFLCHYCTPP